MTATTSSAPTATVVRRSRSFTIAATGDLIIHKAVARTARTADGWDFTPMFSQVREILRAADLAVCHLETPMSPDNERISSYPRFNVPNQLADAIAHAGYDTCSLASNHSADTGLRGVTGMIEALDRAGVAHTGMARTPDEQERLNLVEVKGATVAHLSYTYGLNIGELRAEEAHMVNIVDEQAILEEAGRARGRGRRLHHPFPALGNGVQPCARPVPGRPGTAPPVLPRYRSHHRPSRPCGAARGSDRGRVPRLRAG